ncbi:hypothetical protein SNE40_018620 [Patella caerulea]|uniref:Uncharacterized protein n=1 Tax=Patella caerulea TaxID=87958 RepID=A0AAN8J5U6_PATCE
MTSNTKSRESRGHVMRPDYYRRQMVAVPMVPIKVSPEMANAIRRRQDMAGVEYWNQMAANGIVSRPMRRLTVEQAFPRMYTNGYANIERIPNNTAIRAREPSRKSQQPVSNGVAKHHDNKVASFDPKKATATDLSTVQSKDGLSNVPADLSRNYQIYDAKVRYVDNGVQRSNLATKNESRSKGNKKKDSKSEDTSKQNGHRIPMVVTHTTTKSENGQAHKASGRQPNYIVTQTENSKMDTYRRTWSEMAHLSVNGSVARISEPTFQKIGMNHTFRIPRPKAMIDPRGSVAHRRINLTASKKRAVRFGQDKVYEYTPLEPVDNIPIHEELL